MTTAQTKQITIPSPIVAQMQAILGKDAQADCIALVWPDPIELGDALQQVADTTLRFVYCRSQLAMRESLVLHHCGPDVDSSQSKPRLVMLSRFDETDLAKDVLARLWGHEPKRISPWRTLEQLLRVREIDPRLTAKGYRWVTGCLLNSYDRYKTKIQFGEVLDFDKAWRALALGFLDYAGESVDLDALLEWSRGRQVSDAVAALPADVQEHLADWLEPRLGKQAQLVQALWRQGYAGELLGVGLVCSLLYPRISANSKIPPNPPFSKGGTDGGAVNGNPPFSKGGIDGGAANGNPPFSKGGIDGGAVNGNPPFSKGGIDGGAANGNLPFSKGGIDGGAVNGNPPLKKGGQGGFSEILQARGRFNERFLGGLKIELPILQTFGTAAVAHVERYLQQGGSYDALGGSFAYAEQVLASIDLMSLALQSDVLPDAFEQRLDQFAAALKRSIGGRSKQASSAALLGALATLQRHRLSTKRPDQMRRAELAVRTASWLQTEESTAMNATEAIGDYVDNGGYLDWARSAIWCGDEHEILSQVYQQLSKKAGERRERLNQQFSEYLPAIARGDSLGNAVLPVESALDELLVPLAKQQPVLLLVLDGMSQAVYRELSADLLRHSWVELLREAGEGSGCLLAALPTITRVSRYSLLAGIVGEGVSGNEKSAFASHAGLKKLASTKYPPVLFHKADLQQAGSGALADPVREVIAGQQHKVVGAVINAVDDQLSSGAQLSVNWSVASVSLLRQILEAARESGRLVVVTSDHGHVLDHDMRYAKTTSDAERYKQATEKQHSGEVMVSGPRVVQAGHQVILPWSEKIRYASKKMGYHGGGSPQEVIIPVGVYRNAGETAPVEGWHEVPRQEPDWWRLETVPVAVLEERPRPPVKTTRKPKQDPISLDLFAQADLGDVANSPLGKRGAGGDSLNWLSALFVSPIYAHRKSRGGRVIVDEAQLQRLLRLLAERGGQQMVGALIQSLGMPSIRMNGFLAGAQKLLNVDGYPVLSIDRATKTVKLNIESLKIQFEL